MKVIFLDVDGVLNKVLVKSRSEETDIVENKHGWMNKSLVGNLNSLTDTTGAKLVISSSWRYSELDKNKELFASFGVTGEVIGQTPHLGQYSVRGNEIYAWIKDNEDLIGCHYWHFKEYVILDDDSDMLLWQEPHFIHTDAFAGLSDSARHKAEGRLMSFKNLEEKQTSNPLISGV